jgi:hypothetical protein
MTKQTTNHGVPFGEAMKVWARVAALSFGGPAGQIAVMHRIIVEEKRWIGENRFLQALNYCTLLPGPEAQQLAIYIGWLMHRTKGGLFAGTLFVLPGLIAIMALSWIYVLLGKLTIVEGLFFGLKAAVLAIVSGYARGTRYRIHADVDGLLAAGEPGVQLTWMDAKVGDWVVTPRHGKPVEINALWHGALCLMAEWGAELSDSSAAEYLAEAQRVRDNFRAKFWNAERDCLYDVLGPDGPVGKMRPNQIFAVSLPHALLNKDAQRAVVRAVERELLTPLGLRTLEDARDARRQPREHAHQRQLRETPEQPLRLPPQQDHLEDRERREHVDAREPHRERHVPHVPLDRRQRVGPEVPWSRVSQALGYAQADAVGPRQHRPIDTKSIEHRQSQQVGKCWDGHFHACNTWYKCTEFKGVKA